ncbi:DUF3732 domain-containing protein [Methylobacterium terrae]|uniref:DUF3732 domain-containing protein n=1 Tax=Methylobacterium terrae TaxID=2202827 RepID=A0A2U8WS29_9HYPH|nr:DUF3732 domain-containing protein [Methylobacterium terrae]AWN49104.1 DUF3732 domain-containing protein [Methylobacterium terrae]
MRIKSIHLYSGDGRRRDLMFHAGLNIITGRSSTGKSALSEIIEYCMGRSTFLVPEGAIQDRVAWYAVIYHYTGEEVLVAKPAPRPGVASCSLAMVRRGAVVEAPEPDELIVNDNDDGVVALLSKLLGIPDNVTDVPIDQSRVSFAATIQHTVYYLFQKQEFVASKTQLFYRQNEDHQPQTIKDTMPIVLGVSGKDKFQLDSQLRAALRELRLNAKLVQQAREAATGSEARAFGLLSEARAVGILPSAATADEDTISLLRQALSWRPTPVPEDDGRRVSVIEREIVRLRERRREVEGRIKAAQHFTRQSTGFQSEVLEQQDRLASIKALPRNAETGDWQWPFAEKDLGMASPVADALLGELRSLDRELAAVTGEQPVLDSYLASQIEESSQVTRLIATKEVELASAISANEFLEEMGNRNNAAAHVVGRISFFLENLIPEHELTKLQNEERRLRRRIEDLEEQIGADDSEDRLQAALSNIAQHMSGYIRELGGEFGEFPARLDLRSLTVVIDRPGRPVYMYKSGGGANHLAYHLGALLAFHRFTSGYGLPVPGFMLIDQPTQVYFPSETSYKSVGGTVDETEQGDVDLETVRRLFAIMLRFVTKDTPGFQLIVSEHANLRDDWFQKSLVEPPWTKPPALVPDSWPNLTANQV